MSCRVLWAELTLQGISWRFKAACAHADKALAVNKSNVNKIYLSFCLSIILFLFDSFVILSVILLIVLSFCQLFVGFYLLICHSCSLMYVSLPVGSICCLLVVLYVGLFCCLVDQFVTLSACTYYLSICLSVVLSNVLSISLSISSVFLSVLTFYL